LSFIPNTHKNISNPVPTAAIQRTFMCWLCSFWHDRMCHNGRREYSEYDRYYLNISYRYGWQEEDTGVLLRGKVKKVMFFIDACLSEK
jgi:hypothetical protein